MSLINDERLIDAIVGRGFAILAPNALKRRYVRHGTSSAAGQRTGWRSKRKFLLEAADGSVRELRSGKDRGWYFSNVDTESFKSERGVSVTPAGRREADFIRAVLFDAKERFSAIRNPSAVIGIGHGGSLTWQLACESPDFASIFAPVNGAFWMSVPRNCRPGAKLVHTHYKESKFWPLKGIRRTSKLFARTSIDDNLSLFGGANACSRRHSEERVDKLGLTRRSWGGCANGASMELMLLDEPFSFQDWWLENILNRLGAARAEKKAKPEGTAPARPKFVKPRQWSKP